MPETTPLIKAALNLRVGVGFDVYALSLWSTTHPLMITSKILYHRLFIWEITSR